MKYNSIKDCRRWNKYDIMEKTYILNFKGGLYVKFSVLYTNEGCFWER